MPVTVKKENKKENRIVNWCRNFAQGKNHLTYNNMRSLCGIPLSQNVAYPPTAASNITADNTCNLCLKNYDEEWRDIITKKETNERRMAQLTGESDYKL